MLPKLLRILEPTIWRIIIEKQVEAKGFLAYGSKWRVGKGEVALAIDKKPCNRDSTGFLFFLVAVSIGGLALIPALLASPHTIYFEFTPRQALVGALFSLICLLGIFAAFYPAKCRRMFKNSQNPIPQVNELSGHIEIRGHHPNCDNYAPNRMVIGGRFVCAACSGLLIGAIIALIGTTVYFFAGLDIGKGSVWVLLAGEGCMLLGLAQIKFSSYLKALVNLLFVVGSFVVLVETDFLGENLVFDLLVLGLIAFMLWFRIFLSEWNNRRTCEKCRLCFH